jgi:hypothetical protein
MIAVRPIQIEDAEQIYAFQQLHRQPAMSAAAWRQFWLSFPFRKDFENVPLGWLLAADQQVIGVLLNVHMLYDLEGRHLKAGIASGWFVDPEHRNRSLQLLNAYFQQKGIDLWLNDSANATTSKILTALKVEGIPSPDYDAPLLWPIRARAFAAAALRRKGVPAAELLAFPVGGALHVARWFKHRNNRYPSEVHRVKCFDQRFDSLWDRIRGARACLRAVRSSSVLQWRFQFELGDGSAVILVYGAENFQGYAVVLRNFREQLRLTVCDVADLQAVGDNPVVLTDLLRASMHVAREQGAEALRFVGNQGTKRTAALSLRPYSYRTDGWQFYRAAQDDLSRALRTPELWDLSTFEAF